MYKIIGHRGDKENHQENTLDGFRSSLLSDYVSGIELDIQVTQDGKLMVSHDRYYIDSKKNKFYIHDYTYSNYKKLPLLNNEDQQKKFPLLEDVFTLYKDLGSTKTILIEIKTLPASSKMPLSFFQLIKRIHHLLFEYHIQNNCYIISFDYRVIAESKKQNSIIKIGLILERNLIPTSCIVTTLDLDILVMAQYWITKEQVLELNKSDIDVFAWTINTKKECLRLNDLGVKYIITDRPTTIDL